MSAPRLTEADLCLLPDSLRELVVAMGIGPVLALVERYGGTRIAVPTPARLRPDHPYLLLLGREAALALCRAWGGAEDRYLPQAAAAVRCARNREMVELYQQGDHSARELALKYRLSDRQVWNILGTPLPEEREGGQLRLELG